MSSWIPPPNSKESKESCFITSQITAFNKDHSAARRRSFKQTKNDPDSDKNISISPLARFLHNRIQNLDSYEIILTRQHHSDCRPCPKLPSNMVKEDGVQTHVLLLLQVSRKAKKGDCLHDQLMACWVSMITNTSVFELDRGLRDIGTCFISMSH